MPYIDSVYGKTIFSLEQAELFSRTQNNSAAWPNFLGLSTVRSLNAFIERTVSETV